LFRTFLFGGGLVGLARGFLASHLLFLRLGFGLFSGLMRLADHLLVDHLVVDGIDVGLGHNAVDFAVGIAFFNGNLGGFLQGGFSIIVAKGIVAPWIDCDNENLAIRLRIVVEQLGLGLGRNLWNVCNIAGATSEHGHQYRCE
jgi:hypothetical protein